MSEYLNNNNQREIYVDTISRKLIGPGADIFGIEAKEELISKEPTKLYYSGILFSDAYSNEQLEEESLPVELAEYDDQNANNVQVNLEDNIENRNISKDQNTETNNAAFQSFYSNKFGLIFALNENSTIKLTFNFATYAETNDRKIKLNSQEWHTLKPIIKALSNEETIKDHFGEAFFASNNFNYDITTGYLSFNYNPAYDKFNTYNQYKDVINNLFKDNHSLKNKFIFKLCARKVFQRTQHLVEKEINLNDNIDSFDIASNLKVFIKSFKKDEKWIVKVLAQNTNSQNRKSYADCFYQVGIEVESDNFVHHKNEYRNAIDDDYETVNYQYRELFTYGKGINCAVEWNEKEKTIKSIKTTFLPQQEISSFSNAPNETLVQHSKIFELKNLSIWSDLNDDAILEKLKSFVGEYNKWIKAQTILAGEDNIGQVLVDKQKILHDRLIKNIEYLNNNPTSFESFKLANTAMYIQMIISKDKRFEKGRDCNNVLENNTILNDIDFFKNYYNHIGNNQIPSYRPFQLAFLLMNVESTFNKNSNDRNDLVDLIWFPTGGGKTEAYLAVTALTIIERRRHNSNQNTGGVSVMMRYTLRLLTAQQFERATWLICALEFMRNKIKNIELGQSQINIGMWVGSSTTPNNFESLTKLPYSKFFNENNFQNAQRDNKFPVSYCPWCGSNIVKHTNNGIEKGFEIVKHGNNIRGLNIFCVNKYCSFNTKLPVHFIDEELYNNPPTLLFATVDKMVQISHKKEARNLFYQENVLPIDLVIQDELHLLTGPLGSISGLYEILIQNLCSKNGRKPKIIASTATTRNTDSLIKLMYGRNLSIFPAQGVKYDDNFFSFLDNNSKRKHIGIIPTGKTSGLAEIKIIETLYEAKIQLLKCFLKKNNIDLNNIDPLINILNSGEFISNIDPYWTFVLYYNNLRDLGRSKSRVSIDFKQQIEGMFKEQDFEPLLKFVYNRMFSNTVEFTSRQESGKIKSLLSRIEKSLTFTANNVNGKTYINEDDSGFDLALASNMFSVGIDVTRLNIMLMLGQPGIVAEYIQASSRVARKDKGLVINLLNPMRIRELSLFEDYKSFHLSYYKNIEPLSITPFTIMAIEMIFDAVFVGYMRTVKNRNGVNEYIDQDLVDFISLINNLTYISNDIKTKLCNAAQNYHNKWKAEQQNNQKHITSNTFNPNGIFSLMNSLRDIDKDVFINNRSLN